MAMALELAAQMIILILWLLFLYSPTLAQQTNCVPKCGAVSIPYPFGMNPENTSPVDNSCIYNSSYYNKWFEIECRDNHTPFLKSLNLEVSEIDIENNGITLTNPIYRCQSDTRTIQSALHLGGSPFVYSQKNRFIIFGCNTIALLRSNSSGNSACLSSCESKEDLSAKTGCFGKYCCQTTLPLYLSEFSISFVRLDLTKDSYSPQQPCDSTLIADQKWLEDKSWNDNNAKTVLESVNSLGSVPVVLDWLIPIDWLVSNNTNLTDRVYNRAICSRVNVINSNSTSGIAITGWSCHCLPGLSGNPYIIGGCIEVNRGDRQKQVRRSAIIGAFSSLGSISLLIAGWWLYKSIKKRRMKKLKAKYFKQNGGLLLEQKLSSSEVNVDTIKLFSVKDLEKATDRFNVNRVLGKGGQGTVYKGMLVDGKIVAVKKLKVQGNVEDFINEVVILAQINHRNVVKLLGCCLESKFPLLVYEFIPNGTLSDNLHEENEELPMTWDTRLKIAIEVAGALFYLHSGASQPIYHRDIKSSNILLDEKYRAKVADFGASRMVSNVEATHLTTRVLGTFGYLDPEYYYTSKFTEKSDVYSFGVVLLELLTGQKAISATGSDGQAKSLVSHFITCMDEDCLFDIIDDKVLQEGNKEHIIVVANLAKRCLNMTGKKRPTMREVTTELEGIQNLGKVSNDRQNHEEINLVENYPNVHSDREYSVSVNSLLDSIASSSDILPLMYKR